MSPDLPVGARLENKTKEVDTYTVNCQCGGFVVVCLRGTDNLQEMETLGICEDCDAEVLIHKGIWDDPRAIAQFLSRGSQGNA